MIKIFARHILLLLVVLAAAAKPGKAQIDKEYFFTNGRQHLIEKKYAEAITNFNVILNADNTQHDAYFLRGIAKYNLGDLIGANHDFAEAIRLNPVYTQAYHFRAITFAEMGNVDAALLDLNTASQLRPEYPGIYYSRGYTHFMSKQFEKAIDDYNMFIKSEPKESYAYVNRGTAYLFLKDTVKAINDYDRAIMINRANDDAYLKRGRVLSLQKKMQDALADFNKAISIDTTNSMAFFSRALVYNDMKRYNNAMTDFSTAVKLDPDNSIILYNRAILRSQVGDLNNALKDYDQVAKLTPKNVLVYYNRAGVRMELGMIKDAIRDYSKAIELYPDFANAYMNRSMAKRQLNDMKGAKNDYDFATKKIKEYRSRLNDSTFSIYADTSKKFNAMMSFDANTDDEVQLLNSQVDIKLRPMYRIDFEKVDTLPQPQKPYFYPLYDRFKTSIPGVQLVLTNTPRKHTAGELDSLIQSARAFAEHSKTLADMLQAIVEGNQNQFAKSIVSYGRSIEDDAKNGFAYINRSTIQAEMVDFASSIDNTVQPMLLDEKGPSGGKQKIEVKVYNYDQAIDDLEKAEKQLPGYAYIYYNRGNIYTLSNRMPEAIQSYTKAITEHPTFADAYYNRGLVQIYLKDTNKGCLDISKAGELGLQEAYSILKKYCIKEK